MVECNKKGCKGKACPLFVVLRSNKPDGLPARCWECQTPFQVPKGTKGTARKDTQGDRSKSGRKMLESRDARIKELEAKLVKKEEAEKPAPTEEEADNQAEVANLQGLLVAARKVDPTSQLVKDTETKLEAAKAKKLSCKPLRLQLQATEQKLENKKAALENSKKRQKELAEALAAEQAGQAALEAEVVALTVEA